MSNIIRYDETLNTRYDLHCLTRVRGATIIGNQKGDNHHRIWVGISGGGNLLRYDSFNEGQTWTDTTIGIYNTDSYMIVETFYDLENIISKPLVPVLNSPTNNAVNISVTPTLKWNMPRGVDTYHIQISTTANFQVLTD